MIRAFTMMIVLEQTMYRYVLPIELNVSKKAFLPVLTITRVWESIVCVSVFIETHTTRLFYLYPSL